MGDNLDNEIMQIKLDDIIPNRFQPREIFDEEALEKLADSIRQHGVIEPIIVRPVSNKYEIIAGERRYKASVLAGLTQIPAIVKNMDDKESSIIAYIENEHRSDVSAIEEARTINRILKNNNMTQEELANELGINQSTLSNKLRLLNLPLEVQEALMRNEISERHARSLLSVKDENKQIELLKEIKEKRMTVRELDSEIKNMNNMYENNNQMNNNFLNNYLNNPAPTNTQEPIPTDDGFMNFLNNYDANNPLPKEENVVQSMPTMPNMEENFMAESSAPAADEGFMNFLNNYDANNPLPQENSNVQPIPAAPNNNGNYFNMPGNVNQTPTPAENASAPVDEGFMNYLNSFDSNYRIPSEEPVATPPTPPVTPSTPSVDEGFMNFLNNYDANHPLPKEEPVSPNPPIANNGFMNTPSMPMGQPLPNEEPDEPAGDTKFMDYLNNYDANNPILTDSLNTMSEPSQTNNLMDYSNFGNTPESSTNSSNIGVTDYLNNYNNDINNSSFNEPDSFNENIYNNYNELSNTPIINNVTPPITMGSNDYVENNPNYVDVSKQVVISSVDEIINKVKTVVDDIKLNSKFKIDTDEINYDDIYQITIKIDKRDF